jgi:hypothetical protein
MIQWTLAAMLASFGTLLVGCDDPPFPNTEGGPGPSDSRTDSKKCTPTTTTAPGWNCLGIGECAKGCGTDLNCISNCISKGCESGKTTFNATSDCTRSTCMGSCLGGFSAGCLDCSKKACPKEWAACDANQCGSVTTGCQEDSGTAPVPDTSVGTTSCYDIEECAKKCGIFSDCIDACRDKGCQATKSAFDRVIGCSAVQCKFECMQLIGYPNLGWSGCQPCIQSKCAAEWSACEKSKC